MAGRQLLDDDRTTRAQRRAVRVAAAKAMAGALERLFPGPPGRFPGRIPWEVRLPAHRESTKSLRTLYPWLAGQPLPQCGPVFGRELISGALWCFDPWEQRKLGHVGDTGVLISGVIGSGKSAAAKSLVLRHVGFGRQFVVPCDIRGEWTPVVRAVGGKVMELGPGMTARLNALAMPPRPAQVLPAQWWLTVRTHWQELIEAISRTLMRGSRELTEVEIAGVETALTEATGMHEATADPAKLKPICLHQVVALLREPSEWMAAELRMERGELTAQLRNIGLALRRLTEGALQGLVDSADPDSQIDPRRAATVIDISRVQSSDNAIAVVMACAQAVIELAYVHRVQQWWTVYDELWRLMPFPAILRRMNGGQRRSRGTGGGTISLTHRLSDGSRGGPGAQAAMADIISDSSTKIIYRQRKDSLAATLGSVDLTNMMTELLPSLDRGEAIHVVDGKPYFVRHLLPPRLPGRPGIDRPISEWDVIETDHALNDDYRTLADRSDDELYGDRA